jgi:hypothetical protein
MPMSPSQHDRLVTTRADLILDDELANADGHGPATREARS